MSIKSFINGNADGFFCCQVVKPLEQWFSTMVSLLSTLCEALGSLSMKTLILCLTGPV